MVTQFGQARPSDFMAFLGDSHSVAIEPCLLRQRVRSMGIDPEPPADWGLLGLLHPHLVMTLHTPMLDSHDRSRKLVTPKDIQYCGI